MQGGCCFPGGARIGKTIGRIEHFQHFWLLLPEIHLTRYLFGSMVRRINALAVASG